MKRWLRILIPFLEATIFLAVIYFEPTYCMRGKLWNEAFFERRPTSYWRDRVERWINQFETSEQAAAMVDWADQDGTGHLLLWEFPAAPRTPTALDRVKAWVKGPNDNDVWPPPKVLRGGADAEPVLRQLAADARYQAVANRAMFKQKGDQPDNVIRMKNGSMTIVVGRK